MSRQGDQILEEVLSLPPTERAELADRLLTSLDSDAQRKIDESWAAEVEERLEALDRGEIEAIPATDIFRASKIRR
jgi:putative addiction module component (TIGR02574 family)